MASITYQKSDHTFPEYTTVPLQEFEDNFGGLIELSSEALGASIVSCSDEFFAEAKCLLRVKPAVSLKGQFGPNGALFDGWETRRHNPTHDWVIIKLGAPGVIEGFDIDTGTFSGNESPASDISGAYVAKDSIITAESSLWRPVLPLVPLGPAQQHLFKLSVPSQPVTHLKLTMRPDGGIGRLRAYGSVFTFGVEAAKATTTDEAPITDLASVLAGGQVTGQSDQHFGKGGFLIYPGRGKDMGDGWETRRSRGRLGKLVIQNGQVQEPWKRGDWVVIKLGEPGYLEWADVDTAHFVGNFPESVELYGINSEDKLPAQTASWELILARSKTGPHEHHYFQLEKRDKVWTHVRMCIYPDGGVKRLRLYGRSAIKYPNYSNFTTLSPLPVSTLATTALKTEASSIASTLPPLDVPIIPALILTAGGFALYGKVIQSHPDHRTAIKDISIKRVNFGSADKFSMLADVSWNKPSFERLTQLGVTELAKEKINFCVFRCDQQSGYLNANGKECWDVKVLERHEFTTQAFIPIGNGSARYLVLVALPGKDGRPDLSTLRAFMATNNQGISYHPNVWHHPLIAVDETSDFACVVYETGNQAVDCEIYEFNTTVAVAQH